MTKRHLEPSASDDLGPVLDFLRMLWRVNHAMERRSREMQRRLGITAPQRMVIRLAGRFPGATASELAALLYIDPGSLSSLLARLEAAGLLNRVADPEDRRRVRVTLTPRGRKRTEDHKGTVESAVAAVLAQGNREDIRRVYMLMSTLAEQLETPAETPSRTRRVRARTNRRPGG